VQVRPIEFQENFGRVTVEGARQQNVLQREPELARQHMAQVASDEQVLVLRRPNATTETEGTVVDPDERRPPLAGAWKSPLGTGIRRRRRRRATDGGAIQPAHESTLLLRALGGPQAFLEAAAFSLGRRRRFFRRGKAVAVLGGSFIARSNSHQRGR
jgi:hypothetical protein